MNVSLGEIVMWGGTYWIVLEERPEGRGTVHIASLDDGTVLTVYCHELTKEASK